MAYPRTCKRSRLGVKDDHWLPYRFIISPGPGHFCDSSLTMDTMMYDLSALMQKNTYIIPGFKVHLYILLPRADELLLVDVFGSIAGRMDSSDLEALSHNPTGDMFSAISISS